MYSKLPNLVLGFHGCSRKTYEAVLYHHQDLRPSTNPYDWLGHGIYFWEHNYERALQWAEEQCKRKGRDDPAVIGAVISLGHCLNLTDSAFSAQVAHAYEYLCIQCESEGIPLPTNHGGNDLLLRELDCAVIQQLHIYNEMMERSDPNYRIFDSVRGIFAEGKPLYPGSQLYEKTHVQLCIRNKNCIKGYFAPQEVDEWMPVP